MKATAERLETRPKLIIGWLVASGLRNPELLDAGAAVDARDVDGWTPLHLAALLTETPAVIEALLIAGADTSARDRDGITPWDYAQHNEALRGTDAYWLLNDVRFE